MPAKAAPSKSFHPGANAFWVTVTNASALLFYAARLVFFDVGQSLRRPRREGGTTES